MNSLLRWALPALVSSCLVAPGVALAHPHVFVQAKSELVFDDAGYLTAINHKWLFDDLYTAFAIQGLDANGDGKLDQDELSELASVNVQGLEEFGYFTFGDDTKVEMDFVQPHSEWMRMQTEAFDTYWLISEEEKRAIAEDIAAGRDVQVPDTVSMVELNFTLPLKEPLSSENVLTIDVYDPTYYVDYQWAPGTAVTLKNAPGACDVELVHPPELDMAAAAQLAAIGADVRNVPPELRSLTETLVNQVIVTCGDAAAAVAEAPKTATELLDGQEAISSMMSGSPSVSLTELAAEAEAATPTAPSEANVDAAVADGTAPGVNGHGTGLWSQAMGAIAHWQNVFYRELTSYLRQFRSSPEAGLWLMLISFAYGVFHAAGPGHGKAIISSYVVADEQTLKKGIILSFLSSMAQAVTAIVLVGGAGVALSLTSIAMTQTTRWFEVGSYALVFGLGLWMVWTRILRPLIPADVRQALTETSCGCGQFETKDFDYEEYRRSHAKPAQATTATKELELEGAEQSHAAPDHGHTHHHGQGHSHDHKPHSCGHEHHHHDHHHAHHHHDHGDDCCGHSHAADPSELKDVKLNIWSAWSIIVAIGLRPCTGALIVLAFALSQGMIWAGIASTLVMGVGTGITVAVIASLAVLARDTAYRIWGSSSRSGAVVRRSFEVAGSLFVCGIGGALFFASVGWY
ncbi:DUF1007 family protein [Pseudovibrio exalbescens]|uniref:HoxN/HupN/NixA family nickel/cobalt transporter n=1 Tax=Pseudovibrio exalbescens TaxID=197461 RepID=UPI00236620EE|nr:DUF1007 family protein [Pseudovibrio exalbescens]MDD7911815.1 DUF1007 family protein [Pseudovibrio exalbescens]